MSAYTLFISDVHLKASHAASLAALRTLLQEEAQLCDALYILGDFFDFWAGDDDLTVFNQEVIQLLAEFTATGIPTYYMLGNHDFMIGRKFMAATGVQPLKDPTVINVYGKRILLCHGDGLCTNDHKHIRFRKLLHMRVLQKIFTCLPLATRKKIADRFHNKDLSYYQGVADYKLTPPTKTIEKVMLQSQVDFLIHGHTHRPKIHKVMLDNKPAVRCVLGYWGDHAEILQFHADHTYTLAALV